MRIAALRSAVVSAAVMALLGTHTAARAGRPCEPVQMSATEIARAMDLAAATSKALEASGAQVVLLARNGQDLSRYRLRWSHLGIAYRDARGVQPVWRVAHKLNQCGTDRAEVYRQGLGQFYLDNLCRLEGAYVVPDAALQAMLLHTVQDDTRLARWHTRRYSMLAYPWSERYQQSNQWALETLAGAADGQADDRAHAQAWLKLHDYQPTTLHIDALTRLGARITRANVAFDDHPGHLRYSGRIQTVTVDSMFDWLQREHLAGPVQVVR